MFVQYNIIQKLLRIFIFTIVVYLSLQYIPNVQLEMCDIVKIMSIIVLMFIVYELYYPQVNVSLE
ncbi:hypothetical protein BMW23_0587 [Bodo saltans virus]|uniref:Uncharacterized protein n=1 Tax=Bodo saltans virus TaxID=2024608 RepID=A0A2H4UUM0_9VIRU|nr:hypothetical protein QJ851_gp0570 [Bodo saltans virus]ATZ80633.1 hypothetical protein BMW23_0587 [Bodo saltans virus]